MTNSNNNTDTIPNQMEKAQRSGKTRLDGSKRASRKDSSQKRDSSCGNANVKLLARRHWA